LKGKRLGKQARKKARLKKKRRTRSKKCRGGQPGNMDPSNVKS